MKKFIILTSLLIISIEHQAQRFGIGLMGGFNTSFNSFKSQSAFIKTFDSKLGYNVNAFCDFKFSSFIIQPEIGYYNNRIEVSGNKNGVPINVGVSLGDLYGTALIGYTFSHFRFLVGPLFYHISNVKYENVIQEIKSIENTGINNLKLGIQAGIGFDISTHWRIDGRFQKTFTKSDFSINYQDNQNDNISGSLGAVSISLGYNFLSNF